MAPSEAELRQEFERQHKGRNLKQHRLRGTYFSPPIAALWNQHKRTAEWMAANAAAPAPASPAALTDEQQSLIAELDWCIGNGCYGPRTEKVLHRARALLAAQPAEDALLCQCGYPRETGCNVFDPTCKLHKEQSSSTPAEDAPKLSAEYDERGRHWQSHDDGLVSRVEAEDARGEVVVTWDETHTHILAVTRQDDEGRILSVIAEAAPSRQQGALSELDEQYARIFEQIAEGSAAYLSDQARGHLMDAAVYLRKERASSPRAEAQAVPERDATRIDDIRVVVEYLDIIVQSRTPAYCDRGSLLDESMKRLRQYVYARLAAAEAPNEGEKQ